MKLRKIEQNDLPTRVDWMNHPKVYQSMHFDVPVLCTLHKHLDSHSFSSASLLAFGVNRILPASPSSLPVRLQALPSPDSKELSAEEPDQYSPAQSPLAVPAPESVSHIHSGSGSFACRTPPQTARHSSGGLRR